jgi:ribosomal protein L24E
MGLEDIIGQTDENDACIVCEKPVRYGTGFAHIKHEGKMVTLCCPLCMETFQKNPKPYLIKRQAREIERSLKRQN